jgi:hypothetical protein
LNGFCKEASDTPKSIGPCRIEIGKLNAFRILDQLVTMLHMTVEPGHTLKPRRICHGSSGRSMLDQPR